MRSCLPLHHSYILLKGYQSTTVSDGSSSVAVAVTPSVSTTSTPSTVDTTVVAGTNTYT